MNGLISFFQNNWGILAPVVLLIVSELLSLNPNWKSNGIVQLLLNLLTKSVPK